MNWVETFVKCLVVNIPEEREVASRWILWYGCFYILGLIQRSYYLFPDPLWNHPLFFQMDSGQEVRNFTVHYEYMVGIKIKSPEHPPHSMSL